MEDKNIDNVILLDEAGEECEFEHILTFMYEGERYVALCPIEEAEDDEAEVVLLHIVHSGSEDTYVTIDNEVLLNEVFKEFLELMEERENEDE